jgi:3-oxoadipate enol-lactonase
MATATVNGIDIYYERWGSGPHLLYFNASGASLATTRTLIDPYAEAFDVAAHDQRGLGQTSIPPGPYTMADYASDAAGLLDHLGWDTCRVVGFSFGGMAAQEFAVTWPERVERLALGCTSPGGAAPSYPLHELADLDPAERGAAMIHLVDTRFTPEWMANDPASRWMAEAVVAGATVVKTAEQLRGEREQLEARRHHDVIDRLGRIAAPTLVACGRFDGIAPLANGELIARSIPGAELRVYDGGHIFSLQDPRARPDIISFMSST